MHRPVQGVLTTTLVGEGATTFAPDYAIVDPQGLTGDLTFSHQHHVQELPSGELQMFDNEEVGSSRVPRMRRDPLGGTDRPDGTLIAACPTVSGGSRATLGRGIPVSP